MSKRWLFNAGLACLLILFGVTGCQTGGNGENDESGAIKSQGVYTALATGEPGLDMTGPQCRPKSTFGPDENVMVVVLGYGDYNRPQLVRLEAVESSTKWALLSKECYADYGKAIMQPLPIRLSGDYKVRLLMNGTEIDACQFTVTRTNRSGLGLTVNTNSTATYAKGIFSVGAASANTSGLFDKYDDKLDYVVLNAITKEAESANVNLFAQRAPGKVVIQCRLDFGGRITEPKILENTLDDECGELFQKALMNRSPYAAWPDDTHQKLGSDYRNLKLTFGYN